jgi:hypothetical protein
MRWVIVGSVVVVLAAGGANLDRTLELAADLGVLEDTTEYSKDYSEDAFRRVSIGMTMDEVAQVAGKPLEEYLVPHSGQTGWRYTRSVRDGNYRVRVVLFHDGRVVKIKREFYLD